MTQCPAKEAHASVPRVQQTESVLVTCEAGYVEMPPVFTVSPFTFISFRWKHKTVPIKRPNKIKIQNMYLKHPVVKM